MSKETGLEDRYEVIKKSNPNKKIDCIVLEFDDPFARVAIAQWSIVMAQNGYLKLADEVMTKLLMYWASDPDQRCLRSAAILKMMKDENKPYSEAVRIYWRDKYPLEKK